MKRVIFILILVVLTISVYSQNWNLVNTIKKYNYSYGLSNDYNTTVMVDSTKIINGDSIFYLNRIAIISNPSQYNYNNYTIIDNQPTFLMRKVKKHNNIYTFNDTVSYTFIPDANIGASWIFDTVNNITAQVINLSYDTIVGVHDSIKYIRLSTNDTIIISKHFGIVKFQLGNAQNRYKLIGVEAPSCIACSYNNFGYVIPKFRDFFDFNVGDVFQYRIYSFFGGQGSGYNENHKKITILTKTYSNNAIHYTFSTNGTIVDFNYGSGGWQQNYNSSGSITYIDSTNNLANTINNELYIEYIGNQNYFNTIISVSKNNNGILEKSSNCGNALGGSIMSYTRTVAVGLGQTINNTYCFEATFEEELMGYVKNGDTTGYVRHDYPVNIGDNKLNNNISIYPNPTNNTLNITNAENSDISIYNLLGELVLKTKCNDANISINVSGLAEGTYIVKIVSKDSVVTKKISLIK